MNADDTQLFVSFHPSNSEQAVNILHSCVEDIRKWMASHHLKLNEDKTEVLLIGNKASLNKMDQELSSTKIGDSIVDIAKSARNIGEGCACRAF